MKLKSNTEIKSFLRKNKDVREAITIGMAEGLGEEAVMLNNAMIKALTGPNYGKGAVETTVIFGDGKIARFKKNGWKRGLLTNAGKLPVPIRTGILRGSIVMEKVNKFLYSVKQDATIAPYGKWVHWGTKWMKARKFMTDVVEERRLAFHNRNRYRFFTILGKYWEIRK